MDESYHVAVVGAGPCGSCAALTAASLGAEVIMLEEHEDVGEPSHCAGHVSIEGMKRLGISVPHSAIENEIKGARIYPPQGKYLLVERSAPIAYVLDRVTFDRHLANLAAKAGVKHLLGSRVESLLVRSNSVAGVRTVHNEEIGSRIVIDAEGVGGSLLADAQLHRVSFSQTVYGAQAEVDSVRDVDTELVEIYLGHEFAPGFFAWIIPKRDGSAKVGLATSRGYAPSHLRRFVDRHRVASMKLHGSTMIRTRYHPIPLAGGVPKTYWNGLLVVGDAASHVKPTTGGGLVMGMTCARIAGSVAATSVRRRCYSEDFLSSYHATWRKEIGFDLDIMRHLRKIFLTLSDEALNKIISTGIKLKIDEQMENVESIDFQGRTLLKVIRSPKSLLLLLYLLTHSLAKCGGERGDFLDTAVRLMIRRDRGVR